jgi:hypothetical protein
VLVPNSHQEDWCISAPPLSLARSRNHGGPRARVRQRARPSSVERPLRLPAAPRCLFSASIPSSWLGVDRIFGGRREGD